MAIADDIGVLLLVVLGIMCGSGHGAQNVTFSQEARILRMLSNIPNYDKRARPIKNSSLPIMVEVELYPRSLVYLNDENQRISMGGYFSLYWKDEYLCWNPDDYGGIKRLVIPDTNIWKPDIIAQDSLGGINDMAYVTGPIDLLVTYDGTVTWYTNRVFVKPCTLRMTYFPFDTQTCDFRYESRTHGGRSMILKVKRYPGTPAVILEGLKKNPDGLWDFVSADAKILIDSFEDWSIFLATITLKRKPMYFIMNILCPCMLISFLIPVMFCLPPESGERMSVQTTILLAFSVFQMVIAEALPKTSDTIPIIVSYLLAMMGTSAMSIILTVIILHLHIKGGATIPRWLRVFLFNFLAKVLFMSRNVDDAIRKTELSKLSRDKAKFEVYENYQVDDVTHVFNHVIARDENVKATDMQTIRRDVTRINKTLNEFLNMKRRKVDVVESREQGILAARVLDRFFLIVYFFINVVAAIVFFRIVPSANAV